LSDTATNLFLIALEDTHEIGYAKMRRDRTYDEFKGEKAIEIERIYVQQEFQKKKIGKLLMDECIKLARQEKNKWLWLAVNNENKKALGFYFAYGFETFGTKKFKLGTAIDEDLLMKLDLAQLKTNNP
jgi:ribosomal protein S18 acetylase RimI-like enzyme